METTTQMDENTEEQPPLASLASGGKQEETETIEKEEQSEVNNTSSSLAAETTQNDIDTESIEEGSQPSVIEHQSSLSGIASALKSDLKAQVEAVLFVSDTPVKTGAISKMLNASYDDVQSALVQLIQEYEDRNGGLEIATDDGYIIQVKTQYLNIVTNMMPLELNPGPMRTLSAIALKEPVLQSEVIDMRGSGAYDHINNLVEQDLITKKPQGLTYVLKTTTKFQQYFRLTQDANKIKEKLQEQALKRAKEKKKLEEEAQNNQQTELNLEQPAV